MKMFFDNIINLKRREANYFFFGTGLLAAVLLGFILLIPEYWYFAFFSEGFNI